MNYRYGICMLIAVMLCCTNIERNNPFDAKGGNWNPPVVTAMADASLNINDSLIVTATATDKGTVVKYVWAKDGLTYADTTVAGSLKVAYPDNGRHVVRVVAIDDDGVASAPDSCVVTVTLDAPVVTAMADASVNIKDSLTVTATATDNGTVVKYVWAKDGATYADTTVTGSLKVAYADNGRHVVRVVAIDDDGVASAPDSCVVTVTLDAPVVTAMADASLNIKDSLIVTATATDNGAIVKYLWAFNGGKFTDTTITGSIKTVFNTSGYDTVWVKAVDDDGVESVPDFCIIAVSLGMPVLQPIRDTLVSQNHTVTIYATATDVNNSGVIEKYYWDIGANGWDDSTDVAQYDFTLPSGGELIVVCGARDDDDLIVIDTFHILFSRSPISVTMTDPDNGDTVSWLTYSDTAGKGDVALHFIGSDPDSAFDTLTYSLYLGADSSNLQLLYTGKDSVYTAVGVDTSKKYYWRVTAKDIAGDSVENTGTFVTAKASDYTSNSFILVTNAAPFNEVFAAMVFQDKIWVIDGDGTHNFVRYSTDGVTWTTATDSAEFSHRDEFAYVVFQDTMWVISGGYYGNDRKNDVWYSVDGANWTLATSNAGFEVRHSIVGVVHNNKIWITNGSNNAILLDDVWSTDNGFTWQQETAHAEYPPRLLGTFLSFNAKLWIIGGNTKEGAVNDVWASDDGKTWTEKIHNAPFKPRAKHTSVVFKNKMWVIAGSDGLLINDVWCSDDGVTWQLFSNDAEFPPRVCATSVVYKNKLWIISGENKEGIIPDVWCLK